MVTLTAALIPWRQRSVDYLDYTPLSRKVKSKFEQISPGSPAISCTCKNLETRENRNQENEDRHRERQQPPVSVPDFHRPARRDKGSKRRRTDEHSIGERRMRKCGLGIPTLNFCIRRSIVSSLRDPYGRLFVGSLSLRR
jgi:hypothetical protein